MSSPWHRDPFSSGFATITGNRQGYLYYALLAMRPRFASMFRSNTQNNLNAEQVGNLDFALPPLDEQQDLTAHIDRQSAKMDALIAKAEEFVLLARERRAALITAAVTGQIDVLGEAG